MQVAEFDFALPENRIALRPAMPRDSARLLVVHPDTLGFADRIVADLPNLLAPGDALVVNDTRVIPARLLGARARGAVRAKIEATLHKRHAPDAWWAFVRPAKKLAVGERVEFGAPDEPLSAEVLAKQDGGEMLLGFSREGATLDAALARWGSMPLPPYVATRRAHDDGDARDYQTMFAAVPGAVAAPTAGLHFTPGLVERLRERGITIYRVTLEVGAGTFLPVKVDDTQEHRMHAERGIVHADTALALNRVRAAGGRIVATGTTSLRLLESAAAPDGTIAAFDAETSIFITPGYRFRAVDALLTNFHLPRSTLFMLVCAFCGLPAMKAAYAHAIAADYRFYSYGDASLLWPARVAP